MNHRYYLEQAINEALSANTNGHPVGCIIVDEKGNIIASAHNQIYARKNRSAHAEMLAIQAAISNRDEGLAYLWTLYTTLEPCPMCLGTIVMCHIGKLVWAAPDKHIDAHKLLTATPFMRAKKLVVIASPFPDLEERYLQIHRDYWLSRGRSDVLIPANQLPADSSADVLMRGKNV